MFLLDSPDGNRPLIFSASDLVGASECQYRTLRTLDEKLGRTPKAAFAKDEMLERAARLGDAFEEKILREYQKKFGDWDPATGKGVKVVERAVGPDGNPTAPTWEALEAKREETLEALRIGADVVFQATFFNGSMVGFADFLVRGTDGSYAVHDTKLARHTRVSALLQLAAYGDQLLKYDIPVAPVTTLVLGDKKHSPHAMADLLPVFREHRERFLAMTAEHRAQEYPVTWLQENISYCGRCDYCSEQVKEHQDLLLVNGMTGSQRRKLMTQGVISVRELAELSVPDAKSPLFRLRDQARMQLGLETPTGSAIVGKGPSAHQISYKVLPTPSKLPQPSDGDIFFDFEGDPLWQDPATDKWGLEYLFGSIEAVPKGAEPASVTNSELVFKPFWAHSRVEERKAFLDFLAYVQARRKTYPDMHVYHYAPYEKSALRNLSVLHGDKQSEDTIDEWLRIGLLVDLLDTVRQSVRISDSSYSIKKLEPFYMGTDLRAGDVKDAGASVVAYADYCEAYDAGQAGDTEKAAKAEETLASISDYNRYDCVSTLRLRDWLLEINAATTADVWSAGSGKLTLPAEKKAAYEPSPEEAKLDEFIAELREVKGYELTPDEAAIELVSAAASYHRREDKKFWWGHFDRLDKGPDNWTEERNMLRIDQVEVLEGWAKPADKPRARTEQRTLRVTGTATEGSDFRPGTLWFGMYDAPLPHGMDDDGADSSRTPTKRGGLFNLTVLEDVSDPATPELTSLLVMEKSTTKVPPYDNDPIAMTPDKPVPTASIRAALAELAATVGSNLPHLPQHAGLDILRRAKPRLADGASLPSAVVHSDGHGVQEHDYVGAITEAVANLENSYLAVQGPPGTGKTHVGSHVIANLMQRGWKIGVVGQSHAVVENLLRKAIEKAGVNPERVGKKINGTAEVPWKIQDDKQFGQLQGSEGGALIGGTAWTMTGSNVPEGSLDLLVIDEAGQFSLANTLAVARSAKRLLLLGDPQQLPQVTQGKHPAPVDESALGWLSAGHSTLPADMGYFLADSWRMHPELCAAVSRLSYDGKLESAPSASERHLEGKAPGVETVFVSADPASGNIQTSPEEAAEVVSQAKTHLGLSWTPAADQAPRKLEQADILVVAAYNAQVHLVRQELDRAGLQEVRVGTVDKFQGQEAPVVLATMACADPTGAPRGMEFLLNRNRINVAISRGQWRSVIIRSPELSNFMPSKPEGMAELGAFIGLCATVHSVT